MAKQRITSITFLRVGETGVSDKIVISVNKKIPAIGYGPKEIRKLLRKWERSSL